MCDCELCTQAKRFAAIAESIPNEDDRKWMLAFLDEHVEIQGALEMEEKDNTELKAENAELLSLVEKAHALQPKALRIMEENGLKIEDFNDPMQKLAFTFYSMMAGINYDIECYYENQEEE